MNFGEQSPAFWIKGRTQSFYVNKIVPVIAGSTCKLVFLNAHTYEVGMRLYFNNIQVLWSGGGKTYAGYAYVISKTSYEVDIDIDLTDGNIDNFILGNSAVKGYMSIEYATIEEPNFIVQNKIVHTSIINWKKRTLYFGHYSNFVIKDVLFQLSDTNRENVSKLFYKYNGTNLLFYPHIDKDYLKDASGSGVEFNIDVQFTYIDNVDFRDIKYITAESQSHVSLTQNIG